MARSSLSRLGLRGAFPLAALPFVYLACGGGSHATGSAGTGAGSTGSGTLASGSGGSTCVLPMMDCGGGTCSDPTKDPNNCGSCGTACGPGGQCCGGTCVTTADCSFSVTSAMPTYGWQNGGDYIQLTGSGFVKGMKAFIADGRAALLVQSPTTALIKTPPGPLGFQDITIQSGANKAVLHGTFQYKSAGLTTPWQQKKMPVVRGEGPGVAVMQDGRVLIAGGTLVPDSIAMALNTAILYTRSTDMVTDVMGTMSTARWHDSAVTLLDGRVLVVGGACTVNEMTGAIASCNGDAQTADLFDPATSTWKPSASKLTIPRAYTRSVLLPDGRVLISSANSKDLDLYDPVADTFTAVPNSVATTPHIFGWMTLLRDGRAIFGGGDNSNTEAEIFDPDTNMLVDAGPMTQGRSMLTAHTLPDGRVFVIGGASVSAGAVTDPLANMEAYDPKTGKFAMLPYQLSIGRCWHASALVRDGTILVMGGYTVHGSCSSLVDTVDQVDPTMGTVTPFAVLPNANTEWCAVTLLDGSVLGVGGGACGTNMALPDIDFLPGAPTQM